MNARRVRVALALAVVVAAASCERPETGSAKPGFHGSPPGASKDANPVAGGAGALQAGRTLFLSHCAGCHGRTGEGGGNVPALAHGATQQASDGEVFWFITQGDAQNGMPAWSQLAEEQRWQIVGYLRTLGGAAPGIAKARTGGSAESLGPPPAPPFSDVRYEVPGTLHRIAVQDLPEP